MKNISKIALLAATAVALLTLPSCDKHDMIDDVVYVGQMAPHVFWDIPSTTLPAGNDVSFNAKYYTTGEYPISHLEVWYNVIENEEKNVSAPWMVSTSYSITSATTIERRISQLIKKFAHDEARWNADERSYKFTDNFPTSNTLSKVTWGSAEFDSAKVDQYFGTGFMQQFKDSLFRLMQANPVNAYKDFNALLQIQADSAWRADNFLPYVADTFDENSQTTFKHFVGDRIPATIETFYQGLGFEELIMSAAGELSISYSRGYTIKAQLRCVDQNDNAGLSLISEITLN